MTTACALPCLPAALWSLRALQEEALWPDDFRPWPCLRWALGSPSAFTAPDAGVLASRRFSFSGDSCSFPDPLAQGRAQLEWCQCLMPGGGGEETTLRHQSTQGWSRLPAASIPAQCLLLCPGADPQCMRAECLTCVWLSRTPRTAALQAPLSTGSAPARVMEQVAISSSRGSSQPRDWTCVSCVSCIGRQILYCCDTWEFHWPPGFLLKKHPACCSFLESLFPGTLACNLTHREEKQERIIPSSKRKCWLQSKIQELPDTNVQEDTLLGTDNWHS